MGSKRHNMILLLVWVFTFGAATIGNLGATTAPGLRPDLQPRVSEKIQTEALPQGDARAQARLGLQYDRGEGVRQDHVEAVKWYLLARMTPEQIAEAQRLASEWKPPTQPR
jgi:uncharacterized protein